MQTLKIARAQDPSGSGLLKKVTAAQKAGVPLSAQAANKIFGRGHESRLRSDVERAVMNPAATKAIQAGVLTDHRAISAVLGFGDVASRILLETEVKLGRHLSRERAYGLKKAYQSILDKKKWLSESGKVVCIKQFQRMVSAVLDEEINGAPVARQLLAN